MIFLKDNIRGTSNGWARHAHNCCHSYERCSLSQQYFCVYLPYLRIPWALPLLGGPFSLLLKYVMYYQNHPLVRKRKPQLIRNQLCFASEERYQSILEIHKSLRRTLKKVNALATHLEALGDDEEFKEAFVEIYIAIVDFWVETVDSVRKYPPDFGGKE